MPNSVGARGTLKAKLDNGGDVTEVVFGSLEVVPGEPANITIAATGEANALGVGEINARATVVDQHNNPVADGTPVRLSVDGDAKQPDIVAVTLNGQVSTQLKGGAFPSTTNQLSVAAGSVETNEPFTVHPFNIEIETFTSRPAIGSTNLVNVVVTDVHGDPVPDVELGSTYGRIQEKNLVTNNAGRVSATLVSPANPGQASLSARVGFAAFTQQDYEVVVPDGQAHPVDARRAMVVGDQTTAGYLTYNRYDGTDIEIDYPTMASIDLQGTSNGTIVSDLMRL